MENASPDIRTDTQIPRLSQPSSDPKLDASKRRENSNSLTRHRTRLSTEAEEDPHQHCLAGAHCLPEGDPRAQQSRNALSARDTQLFVTCDSRSHLQRSAPEASGKLEASVDRQLGEGYRRATCQFQQMAQMDGWPRDSCFHDQWQNACSSGDRSRAGLPRLGKSNLLQPLHIFFAC